VPRHSSQRPHALPQTRVLASRLAPAILCASLSVTSAAADKRLLWGDTHLHTSYSFDAFLNNNWRADPDTAYRFAKGQPVEHPYHHARVQLSRPLDFLAVSDHAEFLGVIRHVYNHGPPTDDLGLLAKLKAWYGTWVLRRKLDAGRGVELFGPALPPAEDPRQAVIDLVERGGVPDSQLTKVMPPMDDVERNTWHAITEAADRHYRPGEFTTLLAWEWSATPGGGNLHRIVISDADGATARRFEPFGFDDSPYPDQLWSFLERTSADTGARFLAIPHNSNLSKGVMFDTQTLRGEPMDTAYLAARRRWEPVAEVTQIKGDSETHPRLSPDDAFADFETYSYYLQRELTPYDPQPGDYLRSALRRGLEIEARQGLNPYQLGLIGSTDAHTGLSSADETNFHGKMATDSIPANKGTAFGRSNGTSGWAMSASGLAAVWATDNTRAAILDAFERREVYATTGPRIALRFHAGHGLAIPPGGDATTLDTALRGSVPMGGELSGDGTAPTFYVEALHDPQSAYLDRIQIVKGWLDRSGDSRERIYDVALSDPARRRADGSVSPVPDAVDRRTGAVDNSAGAPRLATTWQDPEFDPSRPAFYYVRVLQLPTVRHSYLDALALGEERAADFPDTIQERAYSSPIWYRPGITGSGAVETPAPRR
jgi:hypothetical protein